ncbi:uncharacterized protein LOC127713077 [Mytilus californianus]|uniref:uncharacterized protein LOC127713077 n=1 Tax=Mytilus californianus TaxID=6549 RepID=UPI0022483D96|nr:uncharacterized protein LOC127713077 [Mytilus californianus]
MCFPLLGCLVDVLPYICVVTVPVYGSFCGIDLILRVSILFYAYALITQYGPNFLHYILPYLNLSLLVLTLIYLPINLVPYPLVWLYDKILWVTEPALMIAEIVLALNFVMHCSQRVIEKMEEDDSNLWKILTIGFSSLCYALTASASWDIYLEGTKGQMLLLFVVLILCLTMHNMMWMSQEGFLCDVAFSTLCSISVLYAMKEETSLINHPLRTPDTWLQYDSRKSLYSIGFYILNSTMDNAGLALEFLMKFLRPFFLVTLGIRLYSILYIIEKVYDKFVNEDEDIFEDFDEEKLSQLYRSPLTIKLSVIFMFTQMTVNLFYETRGVSTVSAWPFTYISDFYPKDIVFSRVIQIIVVNIFYIWRLYYSDDWTWSEWFSSSL